MKLQKDNRGLAPVVLILLVVVILGAIGFVGWRVMNSKNSNSVTDTAKQPAVQATKSTETDKLKKAAVQVTKTTQDALGLEVGSGSATTGFIDCLDTFGKSLGYSRVMHSVKYPLGTVSEKQIAGLAEKLSVRFVEEDRTADNVYFVSFRTTHDGIRLSTTVLSDPISRLNTIRVESFC